MSAINYDICKEINQHYFRIHPELKLIFPQFFDIGTEEDDCVNAIRQLTGEKKYDEAIALAEKCLGRFPHGADAFLLWQIFSYWMQGKIPTSEFMNYFAEMETIHPSQAYINFDKALLYVQGQEFNKAVEELKKARKKEPNHTQSASLLFLIYYLSGDDQWRSLWLSVQKSGLIDAKMLTLVGIGDALKNRKPSPLYLSGEKNNITAATKEILSKFPVMEMVRKPDRKKVIFIAVDAQVYFRMFATSFMMSVEELHQNDFGVHVHLYEPLGIDLELMEKYAEKLQDAHVSYSFERPPIARHENPAIYYASMRFVRACELLEHSGIEELVIVDADAVVRKSPFTIPDLQKNDVTMTLGTEKGPYWDRVAAGFFHCKNTDAARETLSYIANIILKNAAAGKTFWFIDQLALFDAQSQFKDRIGMVTGDILFGKNLEQKDGTYFWTYTNDEKTRANPMNAWRNELMLKHGIREDWNALARAKYGTMIANVYDEYIGKSLLNHGAWCDDEVMIMRYMLDMGDTVVEVGSNMGSHTVPLAKAVGASGRLYAMEPQRIMFQTMCANVILNSLSNVIALNVACGEQQGVLQIAELDPTRAQNFGGFRPKDNPGTMPVALVTIDSLNLEKCKLIKLDIEGMEIEAMKGARETFKRCEPVLFFESHGDAVREIAAFLKDFGYTVYDFAMPNDPMYLAVTKRNENFAAHFGIKAV